MAVVGVRGLLRRNHPQQSPKREKLDHVSLERAVYGLLGFVAILVLWQGVVELGLVKKVVLSSPIDVVATAISDFGSGVIYPHIWISFQEYVLGFAISLAIGIPVGFIVGLSRRAGYLIDPWLSAVYSTPKVALVPLVIIVVGIGIWSKVVMAVIMGTIPIAVSVITGVRTIDRRHRDIARSFRASRWLTFRSVILPSSVPHMLSGLRLGANYALRGVIIGEFIAANQGIGFYVTQASMTLRSGQMMLGIIILGIFGLVLGELIRKVQERFEAWRPVLA